MKSKYFLNFHLPSSELDTSLPGDSLNCVSAVRTLRYSQIHSKYVAIVKNRLVHLQMELVDLQCNGDLKSKFYLVKLYGEYIPKDTFPGLVNQARTLTALQVQDSESDATN